MILSIVVGVLTGVAANIVTYLFVSVWLPSYRNYVYKGIRLDGDWIISQGTQPADGLGLSKTWILSANLEHKAYSVCGHATATLMENGRPKDVINYDFDGRIFDRFISLVFKNRDASRIAYSVFLLEVTGAGARMEGYRCFYGLRQNRIRSIDCTWHRATRESLLNDDTVELAAKRGQESQKTS